MSDMRRQSWVGGTDGFSCAALPVFEIWSALQHPWPRPAAASLQ